MYKTDALTIAPREYIVAGVGLEPTSAAYETVLETTSRHPALLYSWYDSNIQPSAYQADALTDCATRVLFELQVGIEPMEQRDQNLSKLSSLFAQSQFCSASPSPTCVILRCFLLTLQRYNARLQPFCVPKTICTFFIIFLKNSAAKALFE